LSTFLGESQHVEHDVQALAFDQANVFRVLQVVAKSRRQAELEVRITVASACMAMVWQAL